jgi:integrase
MGKLTAKLVSGLTAPGRYGDGDGLMLDVKAPDRRYWTFRFMLDGRARTMTFGSADKVSLTQARAEAAKARGRVKAGIDPLAEKDRVKAERAAAAAQAAQRVTFAEAVEAFIAAHAKGWRGARAVQQWRSSMARYPVAVFGAKPVAEIDREDVLAALAPIWTEKAVTAGTVRSRIEQVLDYAIARSWRQAANPARWKGGLAALLPARGKFHEITHRVALPWVEVPALVARLPADGSMAERCLRFIALTAVRSAEGRNARWSELDWDHRVWTIPAARMKTGSPLRVPLSEAAVDVLRGLPRNGADFVFWGRTSHSGVHGETLLALVKKLGGEALTVHGFRSSFADWCADTGKPFDLCETALGHTVGSAVRRAYARSDLLEPRRVLMQAWAAFLTRETARIVPFRTAG